MAAATRASNSASALGAASATGVGSAELFARNSSFVISSRAAREGSFGKDDPSESFDGASNIGSRPGDVLKLGGAIGMLGAGASSIIIGGGGALCSNDSMLFDS